MSELSLEGRCSCGSVRYRMTGKPIIVHCCHCRSCQRETGGSFALNAMIESGRVVLTEGTPEMVMTPSDGGQGQEVARCPHCHVALWSTYLISGDGLRFVRVGTLDDPGRLPPDIHVFTRSKQPWVMLPPEAPAVAEMYDFAEFLPEESFARLGAVFGG